MNDLITINETTPLKLYESPKTMDDWISRLESEIKSLDLDISTEKGRENIRSVAYQLARTKAALDKAAAKREAEHKDSLEKAERDRIEEAEAAAKAERDKIAAEEKRKAAEAAARESDKAHKAKINNAALEAIQKASGISDESANAIVIAIAGGHVPNVKIIY